MGYSIKQHDTVEYLGCQLDSKLNDEALASNFLRKINAKLKFLYQKGLYLIPAFRRLLCNALIQPHLCMFFMAFSFREKFKERTSENSKQIYSFLPKFTPEISYRSIAYQKNKVTSSKRQSRTLYCENHFLEWNYTGIFMKCF